MLKQILGLKYFLPQFTILLLLCIFFLLSFIAMLNESVTVDEFTNLPSGYSYIKTGTFHLGFTNPPLAKMLTAIPLWLRNINFTKTGAFLNGNFWAYGYDFMFSHRQDYKTLFRDARLIIILIGLAGACLVFLWAKELYGMKSAYLALFLYSLCPNLLAHSHLVTTDVAMSTFLLAALYSFYRWSKHKSWAKTITTGIFLGLAQLIKFTALILYPILILYLLLTNRKKREEKWLKFIIILLISIVITNSGYLFRGSFTHLKQFHFQSKFMQSLTKKLPGDIPVLLPFDYVSGLDFQKKETENQYSQFLFGTFSKSGWWYYYLVAFIFKVPIAFIVLLLLMIVFLFAKKLPAFSSNEYLIIISILGYFLMLSLFRHNIGFRFVLPMLPLLYILASRIILIGFNRKIKFVLFALIILGYVLESASVFPHYLSFFNSLAGGPKNGYHYLLDSNIDWGQDLPCLKKYMEKKAIKTIDLAYFGRVDPDIYGINYRIFDQETKGTKVAVSVNYYQGYPYLLFKENKLYHVPLGYYTYLKQFPIIDRIGYSILIIEIP